jgi:hypothetical protein
MAKTHNQSKQGWQVSRKFLRFWDLLIIFFIGIVVLLVILRIAVGSIGKITARPMSLMTDEEPAEAYYLSETEVESQPAATQSSQPTPVPAYAEVTDQTINTTDKSLGEVEVSIPRLISPKSSNTIRVTIYRPSELASADPASFVIVEIDNDNFKTVSPVYGKLFQDRRTILIDGRMKVEIAAPAFEVERLFPQIQTVETEEPEKPTRWAWTVIAPETQGVHVINFKVFVDEGSETPSWLGAYQIEVKQPVSTPSEPAKPPPEKIDSQESGWTGMIDSLKFFLDLLAITSTIVGGVFAIVRPYIKKRVDLAEIINQTEPLEGAK